MMRTSRLAVLTLSAALLAGTYIPQSAQAWWFPFHRKDSAQKRAMKARQLAGVPVGLVAGNPPALYWKAADKPKAAVLCLHELGLYNGVFDDLGQRLSRKGFDVYAIDLRGFGGWADIPGDASKMDLDKTLADVKGSLEVIHKLHPDTPVFILGEAMGGALALKAAGEFPQLVAGIISAAPGGDHYGTAKNYSTVSTKLITGGPNETFAYGEELMALATPKT